MEVVCIAKDERFKYHRKLIIGGRYLASKNDDSSIIILGLVGSVSNDYFIGYYSPDMFVDVSEFRDEQLNKLLE